MIIGIDAHNIRGNGGTVIHLIEFLSHANPKRDGFSKLIIWINDSTISKLPKKSFITYKVFPNRNTIKSLFWQKFKLGIEAQENNCDILFFPGGIYLGNFKPFIVLSRSMLPFDVDSRKTYFYTKMYSYFLLKKYLMLLTFKNAHSVIFVSKAIKKQVEKVSEKTFKNSIVIHHGVSEIFKGKGKREKLKQRGESIKLLTVSSHAYHKNLISLVQAIAEIKNDGIDIELKIIGTETKYGTKELLKEVKNNDPTSKYIKILEDVPYQELPKYYNWADIFIAPSQCESFGLPLLEAIMNEKYIVYNSINAFEELIETYDYKPYSFKFNKTKVNLKNTLGKLLNSNIISQDITKLNNFRSWNDCTKETFKYINLLVSEKN